MDRLLVRRTDKILKIKKAFKHSSIRGRHLMTLKSFKEGCYAV